MSELGSAIESLRSEILSTLPDARVEQDFCELHAAVEALQAERLRRPAVVRGRSFARDGFLSAAAWLAGRFSVAWGQARDSVRFARALDQMTRALPAFEHGEISLSAVRILAEAREAEPQAFGAAESTLVDAASRHSIGDLRRVVAHWRHLVEQERAGIPNADDALHARRRLHASVTLHGSVRVDGDLDPETGETLLTALRAVLDADARSHGGPDGDRDDRSPAQRRADALGEICRSWLDRSDRPELAGDRFQISVTVPMEVLTTGPGSLEVARGRVPRAAPRSAPRAASSITRVPSTRRPFADWRAMRR